MSDYYGSATLEDWLAEEVFSVDEVQPDIINPFEKWRLGIENDINAWMDSDDGYGNNLSWRGWGRGFNGIPDSDDVEFGKAIKKGMDILNHKQISS